MLIENLKKLPDALEDCLKIEDKIQLVAKDFLSSKGVPLSNFFAYLVAWGEILAGLGIILGGLLIKSSPLIANIITKISGLTIVIIMINALLIAHSNWSIFIGERGSILFASEQLFLLILGFFFFIIGNRA